jgi:hypothetical protein
MLCAVRAEPREADCLINRRSESVLQLRLRAQNAPELFRLAASSTGTGRTQFAEVPDESHPHQFTSIEKHGKLSEPLSLKHCDFSRVTKFLLNDFKLIRCR